MSSTSPDDMPALEQSFSSAQQVVNVSSDPWVSSTGLVGYLAIIRTQESKNFVTFITADSSVNIEDAQRALPSVSSTRWSSSVRNRHIKSMQSGHTREDHVDRMLTIH
ncbi:hypothetical protein B0H10DRAFT_1964895 [Mycena sp. CBHHK59/15]|nr:hypothetical protein B0H10DRAFT_1970513 [Mycena sp. CBHHK59/15]KAJ6569948.1 hypothetical protein B0H10DRAFT_1964895 [Mycena sp. CBHHK59/15]